MRRLMVGTDGSVSGQVAVAWAAGVAQATDADLVVASARTPSQAEVPPETYERLRVGGVPKPSTTNAPSPEKRESSTRPGFSRAILEACSSTPPSATTSTFW